MRLARPAGSVKEYATDEIVVEVPLCPFMAHYIETHPELHDLLAESHRA